MKDKSKKTNSNNRKWFIFIAVTTFVLSLFFSFISNIAISKLEIIPGLIVLVAVILIGVGFDLIGVSVTVANEEDFHAKASKRIKGAKTSIKMIRNSAKVSNFCADVVGDICGVISGTISAMIAFELTEKYGMSSSLQFVCSGLVASITVCGKAITKEFAKKHATEVVSFTSKFISFEDKK